MFEDVPVVTEPLVSWLVGLFTENRQKRTRKRIISNISDQRYRVAFSVTKGLFTLHKCRGGSFLQYWTSLIPKNRSKFKYACKGPVNIALSFDLAWCKRGLKLLFRTNNGSWMVLSIESGIASVECRFHMRCHTMWKSLTKKNKRLNITFALAQCKPSPTSRSGNLMLFLWVNCTCMSRGMSR